MGLLEPWPDYGFFQREGYLHLCRTVFWAFECSFVLSVPCHNADLPFFPHSHQHLLHDNQITEAEFFSYSVSASVFLIISFKLNLIVLRELSLLQLAQNKWSSRDYSQCGNTTTDRGHTITTATWLTPCTSVVQVLITELVIRNQQVKRSSWPQEVEVRCKRVRAKE